jgi:hypothetical protein
MKTAQTLIASASMFLLCASLAPAQTPAPEATPAVAAGTNAPGTNAPARRPRGPIKWVNPDLPKGAGTNLTHYVLASAALGHDVGYVVWTPPGYDTSKKYRHLQEISGAVFPPRRGRK